MTIIDTIKLRKSVRSYSGKPLDTEDKEKIKNYIKSLPQPLNGKARIELISLDTGPGAVKLGTYGVISGAKDYLILAYEQGDLSDQNAGYLFEQVVLYCTSFGLGTCWLGGTFKKSDFANQITLKNNEVLPIVSPVGYPEEKPRLLDRFMRAGAGSDKRKPFGKLFFNKDFDVELAEQSAGEYNIPLQMLRLAPSASNSQPWRVVLDGQQLHFYYIDKSSLSGIDLGIALCHFAEVCRESDIKGEFSVLEAGRYPSNSKLKYVISWTGK